MIDLNLTDNILATKPILDACCGGRSFWFNKQNPKVLYIDKRVMKPTVIGKGKDARINSCIPDIIMDFTDLKFNNETFKLVVFDPPHLFLGQNAFMAKKYGRLEKKTWKEEIKKGFAECFRVLQTQGILIFKWNECDVKLKDVLALTDHKPLFGHKSGKAMKTHWVCFMKF